MRCSPSGGTTFERVPLTLLPATFQMERVRIHARAKARLSGIAGPSDDLAISTSPEKTGIPHENQQC